MPEQVRILDRTKITTYPTPIEPRVMVGITYQAGFLPPRTIYLPEIGLTPDKEKTAIKADMQKAVAEKPEVIEI